MLNTEQLAAIGEFEKPLLILAGPGTGKTRVITEKFLRSVEYFRCCPEEILALTFSRRAAMDMAERIRANGLGLADLQISTIHSFCADLVREEAASCGLRARFRILDPVQALLVARAALPLLSARKIIHWGAPEESLADIIRFSSKLRDEGISIEQFESFLSGERHRIEALPSVDLAASEQLALWEEIKDCMIVLQNEFQRQGLLDFGDLITRAVSLLRENPLIRTRWQKRFKYILVDEFQDSNFSQIELIALLSSGGNVCVVGDDDQSIYRFRGASYAAFRQFRNLFPGLKEVTLKVSYRLSPAILEASQALIRANGTSRYDPNKEIRSVRSATDFGHPVQILESPSFNEEASVVAGLIQNSVQMKSCSYRDWAVLYRAHSHAERLIEEFVSRGIPTVVVGKDDLTDSAEVRELLVYLRLLANPEDSRFLFSFMESRMLRLSPEDLLVLDDRWRQIRNESRKRVSYFELLREVAVANSELGQRLRRALEHLIYFRKTATYQPIHLLISEVLNRTGFLKQLVAEIPVSGEMALGRINRLYELAATIAREHPEKNLLFDFLALLDAQAIAGTGTDEDLDEQLAQDGVRLMTVHAAKGLEFSNVVVLSLVNRRFPSQAKPERISFPDSLRREEVPNGSAHLEEERRLFYVAMTRAKERLVLSTIKKKGTFPSTFITKDLEPVLAKIEKLEIGSAVYSPISRVAAGWLSPLAEGMKRFLCLDPESLEGAYAQIQRALSQGLAEAGAEMLLKKVPAEWRAKQDEVPTSTGPVIRKPVPVTKLSFTQIDQYQTCPLRYRFGYIFRIPEPPSGTLAFGANIHAALEAFYQELIDGREPVLTRLLELYEQKWEGIDFRDRREEEERKREGREQLTDYFKAQSRWNSPIAVERPFRFSVGPITVSGKIDRLDPLLDGEAVEVIDYKTGRPKDQKEVDKSLQMSIYAIACQEDLKIQAAQFSFYYLSSQSKISTRRSPNDLLQTRAVIEEVGARINGQEFEASPGFHCRSCPFRAICEKGT